MDDGKDWSPFLEIYTQHLIHHMAASAALYLHSGPIHRRHCQERINGKRGKLNNAGDAAEQTFYTDPALDRLI